MKVSTIPAAFTSRSTTDHLPTPSPWRPNPVHFWGQDHITRKNTMFACSDAGGRTWATIATLLTTEKLNGVDPDIWLIKTLERLFAGWPNRLIDDLTAWNHQAA